MQFLHRGVKLTKPPPESRWIDPSGLLDLYKHVCARRAWKCRPVCVLDPRDKSNMCPRRAFSSELELAITCNPELVSTNGRFRWVQDTGFRLGHPSTSSATAPRRHSPAISEARVLVNETQCNFCTRFRIHHMSSYSYIWIKASMF